MNTTSRPGSVRLVWGRRALTVVAWAFVAGLLAQAYLAGRAAFDSPVWWVRHRDFVRTFQWLSPLAVVLTYVAGASRRAKWLAWLTVVLLFLQYFTAGRRARHPQWAALHSVTAVVLVWASIELARRTWRDPTRADPPREL